MINNYLFNKIDRKYNTKLRRIILLFIDILYIYFSFKITFNLYPPNDINVNLFALLTSFAGISIYILTGQYKGITKYLRSKELYILSLRNLLLVFVLFIFGKLNNINDFRTETLFLFWILINSSIGITRFVIRDILNITLLKKSGKIPSVYIYGAGSAGAQLANA